MKGSRHRNCLNVYGETDGGRPDTAIGPVPPPRLGWAGLDLGMDGWQGAASAATVGEKQTGRTGRPCFGPLEIWGLGRTRPHWPPPRPAGPREGRLGEGGVAWDFTCLPFKSRRALDSCQAGDPREADITLGSFLSEESL